MLTSLPTTQDSCPNRRIGNLVATIVEQCQFQGLFPVSFSTLRRKPNRIGGEARHVTPYIT